MQPLDLLSIFIGPIEKGKLNYMVTGSVASIIYGHPRLTHDIDIVMELSDQDIARMSSLFPEDNFYCPPLDVMMIEKNRRHHGHFNIIHHESGYKADIYLKNKDQLHAWGMIHKRRIEITSECHIWLAAPEYVILRKLEYYREGQSEKHLSDIQSMLECSQEIIDLPTINLWVDSLGLVKEWEKLGSL